MACSIVDLPTTLASAPGKVLVVGGYLVLDRSHSGLVVGTDACLYSAVQTRDLDLSAEDRAFGAAEVPVVVNSPQFEGAQWKYAFDTQSSTLAQYASADGSSNRFVQVVLQTTLALVGSRAPERIQELAGSASKAPSRRPGLYVVLMADNDFYSQRETLLARGLTLTSQALRQIPAMAATGKTLQTVNKTGLGSSAAMVTSLVAAVLVHFGVVDRAELSADRESSSSSSASFKSLRLIHNVAQYAHCLAQGKVGSGFDVSAAVYGSHVYRRFSPAVLDTAMADTCSTHELVNATSPMNPAWDSSIAPVAIPPRLTLRLADVDAGSNTPSMVKKVLQWQKSAPDRAAALWSALDAANNRITQLWADLICAHENDSAGYDSAIEWCSHRPSSEWKCTSELGSNPTRKLLAELVEGILRVRVLQRTLGENAGVPIEPPEQTRLLDACMAVPGVCMAAVPGAGGYDAIFCVVLSQEAGAAVERLWSGWTEMSVGPLLANQASRGVSVLDPAQCPGIQTRL
ncbi:phosphomevalonate kinase [Coemansia sp. RSA 552]|nr:phosphomevalonate kinase [Coemansia sp. RSA 552]